MSQQVPVAVVGGGLTGLCLGRALHRRGVESLVLEAEERPGGVVRSVRRGGRVLELGPQRARLVPELVDLVRDLGLEERLVRAPAGLPLYVWCRGRLRRAPLGLAEFLRTDLLSWRGKLRVLAEPLTRGPGEGESVARYFTRALGPEAYRRWAGPLFGGLYGSDPADMPAGRTLIPALERMGASGSLVVAALRRWARGAPAPPAATFRNGMEELPRALWREARGRVRLGARVTALRGTEAPDGARVTAPRGAEAREGARVTAPRGAEAREGVRSRWVLETEDGPVEARHVVLTCPADRAGSLLQPLAPEAGRRLRSLRYNPLAVVHLVGPCGLEGYGYQVALGEGTATRGVTWNASLFGPRPGGGGDADREGVHTASLGGSIHLEVAEWPDGRVADAAREEFRRATGCRARVVAVHRTRMPAWDRSWEAVDGLELPPGLHLRGAYVSRPGIPGRLREAERTARELSGPAA